VIAALGLALLPAVRVDLLGRLELTAPSVLFLPHCPEALYSNLLRSNWTQSRLPLCRALICNSFVAYGERRLGAGRSFVDLAAPLLDELPLEAPPGRWFRAFADQRLLTWRRDSWAQLATDAVFWQAPEYLPYRSDELLAI